MKFRQYLSPETEEEALALARRNDTVILGGMMWLRMQKRTAEIAVDLSRLGLNRIGEGREIGAYVTLRQLETDPTLDAYTHGALKKALSPIVGVQFRNTATVGGSVYGRFGFSDVTALFLALGASVRFAGRGVIPLSVFLEEGAPKDLLTHVILPGETPEAVTVFAHRNAATDFPVLTSAFCLRGDVLTAAVSPAPARASLVTLPAGACTDPDGAAEQIAAGLKFTDNYLGSAAYRARLCRVLAGRAIREIMEGN